MEPVIIKVKLIDSMTHRPRDFEVRIGQTGISIVDLATEADVYVGTYLGKAEVLFNEGGKDEASFVHRWD